MKTLGIMAALVLATGGSAVAQTPTLQISSGGESTVVSLPSEGDGIYGFNDSSSPLTLNLDGSTINLMWVTLDSDPTVSYGLGVTNTAGTSTPYSFTFTTPTILAAGSYNVSASVAGSMTDGASDGVTVLTPATGGAIQQSFVGTGPVSDAGVDLLNSTITAPDSAFSDPIPTASASGIYNLGSSATQISVTTAFQLSAGDSATFSGRFDVAAAPEPRSLGLGILGAGLFALLVARRRGSAKRTSEVS